MAIIYKNQIFPAYIRPQHCVHGPIRFEYKGLWPEARAQYFRQLQSAATDEEGEAIVASTMAALIVKWNLEYPKKHPDKAKAGKPVPITADAIQNELMSHVRIRMMNILTFSDTSDIDPEEPIADKMAKIEQKSSGKNLAELLAETDAELLGNSSEGQG